MTPTTPPDDLAALREAEAKMTPGPWAVGPFVAIDTGIWTEVRP